MDMDVLRRKSHLEVGLLGRFGKKVRWGWKWSAAHEDDGQCRRRLTWGGHEGGVGGHTVDRVLTIPWVISQLSMGSSWSAGLSSPLTLSWINNRITPYTKEERPHHHSIAQSAERETEKKSNVQKTTERGGNKWGQHKKMAKDHCIKMKMRKVKKEQRRDLKLSEVYVLNKE